MEIDRVIYIHSNRLAPGNPRENDSVLWSLGSHDVSIMSAIMERDPLRVEAFGDKDEACISLYYGSDVVGHIELSWVNDEVDRSLYVEGTEGTLTFDANDNVLTHCRTKLGTDVLLVNGEEVEYDRTEPLLIELQDFHRACILRVPPPPRTNGYRALQVLKVLEQAQASMDAKCLSAYDAL